MAPQRALCIIGIEQECYAKHFMKENQIPTPNFSTFSDIEKAKDHVLGQTNQLVIKADGLAAGKGVLVCDTQDEALAAARFDDGQK